MRRHGGDYSAHSRDEANHVGDAVREAIDVAEATGVHVQIAHLKLSGVDNWGGAPWPRSPRRGRAGCPSIATLTRTTPRPTRFATCSPAGSSRAGSPRCWTGSA